MKFSRKAAIEFSSKANKKLRQLSRRPRVRLKHALGQDRSDERYLFHHIPKCAGTSAVDAMTHWFVVVKDYAPGWSESSDPQAYRRFCESPVDLTRLRPYELLVGHFHVDGSYLHQRYPDCQRQGFKLITFVRDPLALQISQYKYEIKMKRMSADEKLEDRLMLRPNYIADRFPCTADNYRETLGRYFFVGTMDHYQDAFDRLAAALGKPPVDVKTYNRTEPRPVKLSAAFLSEFKDRNSLDYKIYEYARQLESGAYIRSPAEPGDELLLQ